MKRLVIRFAPWLITLLLSGCGSDSPTVAKWSGEYPIQVVATTTIVGEMVKAVGRDNVVIKPLIGPGTDPHAYRATAEDERLLASADAVVANGLGLEAGMQRSLESVAARKPFLALAERLPESRLIETGRSDSKPIYDPHVWFDASLFSESLDAVAQWLSELDPRGAGAYRANAAEYKGQLRQLHEIVRNRLSAIPGNRRVLVASHPSFAYFARAYTLETPPANASAEELTAFVVARKVPVVFAEDPARDLAGKEIVERANSQGARVTLAGPIPMESLGPPRTDTGSYTSMIERTAAVVADALSAPTP